MNLFRELIGFAHEDEAPPTSRSPASRIGGWIRTSTGLRCYPLDARPEEICLLDIAHALSNLCRFGGHVRPFFSVGQHSVLVSSHVGETYGNRYHQDPALKRIVIAALLHDATEAYLVDLPSPIKRFLPEYVVAERRLARVIGERFGLGDLLEHTPGIIHEHDTRALVTEKRDLFRTEDKEIWSVKDGEVEPWETEIDPWEPRVAEILFLNEAHRLGLKDT